MTTVAAALLVALAASGDPETAKGSCDAFAERYRELLRARATLEASAAPGAGRAEPAPYGADAPASPAAAAAEADAARLFEEVRPRVEQACRSANRSEFECVAGAGTYGDLAACRLRGLPLLPADRRVADARRLADAGEPDAPRDPVLVVQDYVATGELELSPDLARAAFEEGRREAAGPPAPETPAERR